MSASRRRRARRKALAGAPLLPWWAKPPEREAEIRELLERGETGAAQAVILDELEARDRSRP